MAYEPQVWEDGEEGGTPITAERLNHIEQGIAEIELTEGPEGPQGPAGADGEDGADGFPTEEQWTELVQTVSALQDEVAALSSGDDTEG